MSDICFLIQVFVDAKQVKSLKTIRNYKFILNNFETHLNGAPLTPEAINSFLANAKKRGLTKSSVRTYYDVIKSWIVWLLKRGYLDQFRLDMIEIPPNGKLIPRAPTKTTLRLVDNLLREKIKNARSDRKFTLARDIAIFSMLLECGLRIGEICALTVHDVDMDMQKITVSDSKTSRGRTVYFSEPTAADLRQWLTYRQPGNDYFFQTKRHGIKPIKPEGMREVFTKHQKRADVPHFRLHDLRHACAVYRLANGQSLGDIQMILGHENIETTARYLKSVDMGRAERDIKYSPLNAL